LRSPVKATSSPGKLRNSSLKLSGDQDLFYTSDFKKQLLSNDPLSTPPRVSEHVVTDHEVSLRPRVEKTGCVSGAEHNDASSFVAEASIPNEIYAGKRYLTFGELFTDVEINCRQNDCSVSKEGECHKDGTVEIIRGTLMCSFSKAGCPFSISFGPKRVKRGAATGNAKAIFVKDKLCLTHTHLPCILSAFETTVKCSKVL